MVPDMYSTVLLYYNEDEVEWSRREDKVEGTSRESKVEVEVEGRQSRREAKCAVIHMPYLDIKNLEEG